MMGLKRFLKNSWWRGLLVMVMLFAMSNRILAQKHPQEQPGKEEAGLTKETLAKAIADYVKKDTALKGGFFLVYDKLAKKPLVLTLVKVHDDRLSTVDKGIYFACADFKTLDNHLYDLDIFIKETKKGLEVNEITIHEEDGKARYTWVEENGVWKRKQDQKNEGMNKKFVPEVGDQSPDFTLEDFNGKKFTLSELKNTKAVLLWFTNLCKGCEAKLPEMEKIKNIYEKKGIEVVAVSVLGEDRKTIEDVIRGKKITFRFLYDPKGEVTELFSGKYYPGICPLKNIFLIQRNGKITYADHYPGTEESEIINQLNKRGDL